MASATARTPETPLATAFVVAAFPFRSAGEDTGSRAGDDFGRSSPVDSSGIRADVREVIIEFAYVACGGRARFFSSGDSSEGEEEWAAIHYPDGVFLVVEIDGDKGALLPGFLEGRQPKGGGNLLATSGPVAFEESHGPCSRVSVNGEDMDGKGFVNGDDSVAEEGVTDGGCRGTSDHGKRGIVLIPLVQGFLRRCRGDHKEAIGASDGFHCSYQFGRRVPVEREEEDMAGGIRERRVDLGGSGVLGGHLESHDEGAPFSCVDLEVRRGGDEVIGSRRSIRRVEDVGVTVLVCGHQCFEGTVYWKAVSGAIGTCSVHRVVSWGRGGTGDVGVGWVLVWVPRTGSGCFVGYLAECVVYYLTLFLFVVGVEVEGFSGGGWRQGGLLAVQGDFVYGSALVAAARVGSYLCASALCFRERGWMEESVGKRHQMRPKAGRHGSCSARLSYTELLPLAEGPHWAWAVHVQRPYVAYSGGGSSMARNRLHRQNNGGGSRSRDPPPPASLLVLLFLSLDFDSPWSQAG
ncbi:hypothetical protein B0H10DRAFT_1950779 [Mycena sp. CBHHK59/15]|nr:hypothetical protein B0H10DRAFT_1950779 [Mycena sp. CBHHK59/15]